MVCGMDEFELIKRARDGDGNAMDSLICSYYRLVFSFFYKNTGSCHQSKDLTQEVFIKMITNISRYRPQKPFANWLFAIASNHLKNYYRTRSRRPECTELTEEYAAHGDDIENISVKTDLQNALSHLPQKQREAVILRYYSDFSIAEIAKITGANETTVKARLRYGLDKLKKELEGYDE